MVVSKTGLHLQDFKCGTGWNDSIQWISILFEVCVSNTSASKPGRCRHERMKKGIWSTNYTQLKKKTVGKHLAAFFLAHYNLLCTTGIVENTTLSLYRFSVYFRTCYFLSIHGVAAIFLVPSLFTVGGRPYICNVKELLAHQCSDARISHLLEVINLQLEITAQLMCVNFYRVGCVRKHGITFPHLTIFNCTNVKLNTRFH